MNNPLPGAESPTPRTDAQIKRPAGPWEYVLADFARTLERDLAAVQQWQLEAVHESDRLKAELTKARARIAQLEAAKPEHWLPKSITVADIAAQAIESKAQLLALQADKGRLAELLEAASRYVPVNAIFGDIMNKPVDEVRLYTQIRAALTPNTKKG